MAYNKGGEPATHMNICYNPHENLCCLSKSTKSCQYAVPWQAGTEIVSQDSREVTFPHSYIKYNFRIKLNEFVARQPKWTIHAACDSI